MGATAQVLRDLPVFEDPNLLVGTDHFDDAGVYRLDDSTALVQTLDFFPPLVDDPYTFGQIAASNALSDVYAMGGKPITALNIVGFPDKDLPVELLGEILKGGAERVQKSGAVVAGGHSVRDSEIKYGLSVTGLVHPDRIVTNGGARPGDVLILTKPIGTGTLTSAAKAGKIEEGSLAQTIEVMVELNAAASEAMQDVGVHAATDITGFGLLGHAGEMAAASGVSIKFNATEVPLLEDALRLARDGVLTRAHKATLEHLGDRLESDAGIEEARLFLLADAQTSGGLLIAVDESKSDELIAKLADRCSAASLVGRVTAGSSGLIQVAG